MKLDLQERLDAVALLLGTTGGELLDDIVRGYLAEVVGKLTVKKNDAVRLHLTSIGRNMIATIKVIREFTGYGLRDSKDIIDKVKRGTPHVFRVEDVMPSDTIKHIPRRSLHDFATALHSTGATTKYNVN